MPHLVRAREAHVEDEGDRALLLRRLRVREVAEDVGRACGQQPRVARGRRQVREQDVDDDAARRVLARPLVLRVEDHAQERGEERLLDLAELLEGDVGGAQRLEAEQALVEELVFVLFSVRS